MGRSPTHSRRLSGGKLNCISRSSVPYLQILDPNGFGGRDASYLAVDQVDGQLSVMGSKLKFTQPPQHAECSGVYCSRSLVRIVVFFILIGPLAPFSEVWRMAWVNRDDDDIGTVVVLILRVPFAVGNHCQCPHRPYSRQAPTSSWSCPNRFTPTITEVIPGCCRSQ